MQDERKLIPELAEAVARLSALLGPREGTVQALDGGITNRNFKVSFGGDDYVVRLPGKDTGKLGIDRDAECSANTKAAKLGIAPGVAAMLHDPPCLVTYFVEARQLEPEELRDQGALEHVAKALRTFHDSGERLDSEFDSFRVVEQYAQTAEEHSVELPEGYGAALERAHAVEGALQGAEHDPAPCHNDLLAANFLRTDEQILIVDWEYAGMGDRYFDLGNFAVNNELDEDDEQRLLEAYFGEPADGRRRATLRLMRFMSDFREAMWGVVQSGISELEFDFVDYGEQHFARLAETGNDPRFDTWLEEASGGSA